MIVASVWSLTRDSLRLSLDGVPEGIDVADTERRMLSVEGVSAVHHIHIWAMSTTENALTAHVVVEDLAVMEQVKAELKASAPRLRHPARYARVRNTFRVLPRPG